MRPLTGISRYVLHGTQPIRYTAQTLACPCRFMDDVY